MKSLESVVQIFWEQLHNMPAGDRQGIIEALQNLHLQTLEEEKEQVPESQVALGEGEQIVLNEMLPVNSENGMIFKLLSPLVCQLFILKFYFL
jgi:hypothetical protein